MVEGENQQQVGALNKGDIYLSEEELLLNDIRILDIVFIRRKRKKKKKPNLVLRDKINLSIVKIIIKLNYQNLIHSE